jgi:hypothetical protein
VRRLEFGAGRRLSGLARPSVPRPGPTGRPNICRRRREVGVRSLTAPGQGPLPGSGGTRARGKFRPRSPFLRQESPKSVAIGCSCLAAHIAFALQSLVPGHVFCVRMACPVEAAALTWPAIAFCPKTLACCSARCVRPRTSVRRGSEPARPICGARLDNVVRSFRPGPTGHCG